MSKKKKHRTVIVQMPFGSPYGIVDESRYIRVAFNTEYPLPDYFSIVIGNSVDQFEMVNVDRKGLKALAEIWTS